MRARSRFHFAVIVGFFLLAVASTARAVDLSSCTPIPTYTAWQATGLPAGAASSPAADTSFTPGTNGRVYFAKGTKLLAYQDNGTTGAKAWQWTLPTAVMGESSGTTIDNFPSPVPSTSPAMVIYFGGADGRLYKLDAQVGCIPGATCLSDGAILPLLVADLRRKDADGGLICNVAPGDGIGATPAVLLNAYSGSLFQSFAVAMGHPGKDLVFAMTRNGCGDRTHNAVYAFWSDDFTTPQWVYRGSDTGDKVDAFSEGCVIRYEKGARSTTDYSQPDANDPVLFCGTLLTQPESGQDSVFAINAITTNASKRVLWSHNAGSIVNRPMLNTHATLGERLYVANEHGTLHAYSANGTGGTPNRADEKWAYAVAPGSSIKRAPWIEPRGGAFKDKILVLDTAGVLRAYSDNGSSAGLLWRSTAGGTASWVSLTIVLPSQNKAYVGRNDGFLQQVDLSGGSPEGRQQVTSANPNTTVFDPSLDLESLAVPNVNRLYATDAGTLKRFKVPFCNDPGGGGAPPACASAADCNTWNQFNPCLAQACDNNNAGTNTCYQAKTQYIPSGSLVTAPDGTACDDGLACTSASSPPPLTACTTSDDCPHADALPKACACNSASGCSLISTGGACVTNADCIDPRWPRCGTPTAGVCNAVCPVPTALTVAMGISDTTATVSGSASAGPSTFAPSGVIQIDSEQIRYTGTTVTTFTGLTRGVNGTTPATHPIGVLTNPDPAGLGRNACTNCNPSTVRTYFATCVTDANFCGSVGGGRCCRCNAGSGVSCNDICLAGKCTSASYGSCTCAKPGDRACASGSTCCGANNGGCVDLVSNPQHCGACSADCGTYTTSTATCTRNSDCGTCTSDGNCVGSKCTDFIGGVGTCGKCSVDCGCFFNSDCDVWAGMGAGVCTGAVPPTTLGVCNACSGVCKRLTATGHCSSGVCDDCGGSGSCACDFPSLTELSSSAPAGTSAIAFERQTGATPQICAAYVSTYRDDVGTGPVACGGGCPAGTTCLGGLCQAISLQRLPKGNGSSTTPQLYTSSNFQPQHGVAVPQSGAEVFGNFVIPFGAQTNPGLSDRPPGMTTFSRVVDATPLPAPGPNAPFSQAKLNAGPVGPALDYSVYIDSAPSSRALYFGNWTTVGDLVKVAFNGLWSAVSISAYLPSQVQCGATLACGAGITCGSGTTCAADAPGRTCIAGHYRCNAPMTCVGGTCQCAAPSVCGGGVCTCAGAGELCSAGVCSCVTSANCAAGLTCVNGRCANRVTALAQEQLEVLNVQTPLPPRIKQRHLFVGHGSVLSILNLETGVQTDVDLARAYTPEPATNQSTVNGILGIAVHPQYGDVFVEVKGTNGFRYLLNVDHGDLSCRHELHVQQQIQHTQTPNNAVPPDFGNTSDGHLVFMPDGMLLRFAPRVQASIQTPDSWAVYDVSK